jgi:YCII-related domain
MTKSLTKFLVLYRAGRSAREQMSAASPEEQQAGMQAWMDWAGKAGSAIVDLGSPLAPAAGSAASGNPIGGFSILQAESVDALQAVLEGHPHTTQGGTIEILEFLAPPGM